ncbi:MULTISPECIES: glutathione peroxidase [unclassified Enterococcus]|uniref:glutathione peroxidase n=1 Tax=unclassified Enterococcus TaxID=2608891 RepID=UPI001552D905|nr:MULTISPECIES: glutathione peroxidase [unclassified Enterococcus]MBS7578242.1 glutathione peroxidase [Enterococcus sp. MMGLQ5-2]MBS7585519.1 glutathione peroxidase [Enterococcus sp. MMGLQ5-1]NPD13378.1 glutathione peroxidase [Enterococcus sp. MMGLQ5-1]NPD38073.1 glutathione peroxidase [Enterococcus sp. MMGLQ5-2]
MSIYDIKVIAEDGTAYALDRYRGKTLVIVNTATKCGLSPQFKALEALYEQYQSRGLIVLGFPSNQFKQELTSTEAATEACRTTYGVSFPMHQIADVNGDAASPLFKYLTSQASGICGKRIKWNFTKFLINQDGEVVKRFAPQTTPESMTSYIEETLAE